MTSPKPRLILPIALALLTALGYCIYQATTSTNGNAHPQDPVVQGFGSISGYSFEELKQVQPFTAEVVSSRRGALKLKDKNNTLATPTVSRVDYIDIRLRRTDGKELGLLELYPGTSELAIADRLHVGSQYRFPDVLCPDFEPVKK